MDKNIHQTLGTVAASRVRSREDVLILRPFPLWLFQRGAPEGPDLLLKTLRKEPVDWKAWRESKNPFAACQSCGHVKDFANFSFIEWSKVRANRAAKCLHCEKGEKTSGKRKISGDSEIFTKHVCDICGCSKMEAAFPVAQLRQEGPDVKKMCTLCARNRRTLTCAMCGKTKPSHTFDATMCTLPPGCAACKDCQEEVHPKAKRLRGGWFLCRGCKQSFPLDAAGNASGSHCLNCAVRGTRAPTGWHKCQNPQCQKLYKEDHAPGLARPQICPECRAARQKRVRN